MDFLDFMAVTQAYPGFDLRMRTEAPICSSHDGRVNRCARKTPDGQSKLCRPDRGVRVPHSTLRERAGSGETLRAPMDLCGFRISRNYDLVNS